MTPNNSPPKASYWSIFIPTPLLFFPLLAASLHIFCCTVRTSQFLFSDYSLPLSSVISPVIYPPVFRLLSMSRSLTKSSFLRVHMCICAVYTSHVCCCCSADCLLEMKEESRSHMNYYLLFVFYVNVLNRAQNPAKMTAFQLTKWMR